MSSHKNGSRPAIDLTLWGISDTEVLGIVDDVADEDGWSSTYSIRMQLGEDVESADVTHRSGVGPRLSWLVRYGWLEKGQPYRDDSKKTWQTYRLTAMGHALLDNPDLSRKVENALGKLNPAQRLTLTRELGEYGHETPMEIRTALRRQWTRALGR